MSATISSSQLFRKLLSNGFSHAQPGSTKISAPTVKRALDSLSWDRQGISSGEANSALRWLTKNASSLSSAAKQLVGSFFKGQTLPQAKIGSLRVADAYRLALSDFQKGISTSHVSTRDVKTLLSILGHNSAPARVAELEQLKNSAKLSPGAISQISKWQHAQSSAPLSPEIEQKIKPLLNGMLWLSESDRPLAAFSLGKQETPSTGEFRKILGEDSRTPIDHFSLDDIFSGQVESEKESGSLTVPMKQLKEVLQNNLTDLQAFKVGDIERDLYIVGRTKTGTLEGVVTRVVET